MSMTAILASRPTTEHKLGIGGGFQSLKKCIILAVTGGKRRNT
jgi:hypothetical protein